MCIVSAIQWLTNSTHLFSTRVVLVLLYPIDFLCEICVDKHLFPCWVPIQKNVKKLHAFAGQLQSPQTFAALLTIAILVICIYSLILSKLRSRDKHRERRLIARINEFNPNPLENEICPEGARKTTYAIKPRIVSGRVGKMITIVGEGTHLNLAIHNYLGLADRQQTDQSALQALKTYGVGTCGPRAFFGTLDLHLKLESQVAKFMGVEAVVLYALNFTVMYSSIPAYVQREDVIFADEAVNFGISQGIGAARCRYYYFKHNNCEDLERLLQQEERREQQQSRRNRFRRNKTCRFLILEGIYMNSGTLVNLRKMVALRAKYKCRLFIDESVSFGVLGASGKGVFEHFSVDLSEADLIAGSFEHSLSSTGGFVCGTEFVVEHQRCHSKAYAFSASLPAFQAESSIANLSCLTNEPERCAKLRNICETVHNKVKHIRGLWTGSNPLSPIKYLLLHEDTVLHDRDPIAMQQRVDDIITYAAKNNIALTAARYINERESMKYDPAIKLLLNCELREDDINKLEKVLRDASEQISRS